MKEHFCPVEQSVITYQGKCSWCGEKEALAQPEQEPVAWQLWVGADTPLNAPMGWHFYSTYDSLKSAEVSARTINSYKQAPFAKLVPLYTSPFSIKNGDTTRRWSGKTENIGCLGMPVNVPVTPPQRSEASGNPSAWVGLTDEEVKDIVWNLPYEPSQEHIRAIEAKLKEKNT